ncbi:type I phosphodiesterase/nucleotide pyrophosphatase (plasmid) [Sulfuricella denitrificans skB26]|uniref:Type I phosphodiesterase/nucleotide pyrophosphatase n=2 Tax=Sulfuricella denitrificans TaxID=649841 RepID=S6AE14_SULDS|nr:type I phosphodiesterase/nucleotide pyrophosphatase [Sulfuricella denitrificans skB26]
MMKIGILCLGLMFAVPAFAREVETVLIVSIDALHPDALSEKTSPTLYALMRSGRYTLAGKSVDPPKTLIAHTAMMTGLTPEESGKQDNDWKPGMPQVARETLFDDARQRGFRTAFFYAKQKLGYLLSYAVDEHALARDDGIDMARAFFSKGGKRFAFLHVSGLEDAGTDYGWLSPEYLGELTYIDLELASLLADVGKRGTYLIVVTSDHAGHDRQHGTSHPDDFKLPLIIAADHNLPPLSAGAFHITGLKDIMQQMFAADEPLAMGKHELKQQ